MHKVAFFFYFAFILPALAGGGAREGFAIYLLANGDVQHTSPLALELRDLNKGLLKLESDPLLRMQDIVAYSASEHSILLKPEASARFAKNEVDYRGQTFAVCVDGKVMYLGRIWEDIWSVSCPDVVLLYSPAQDRSHRSDHLFVQAGYPTQKFFVGHDPRSDERVLRCLREAGKLAK